MASPHHATTDASSTPELQNKTITVRSFMPADLPAVVDLFSAGMLQYAYSDKHSDEEIQSWVNYIEQCLQEDLADIERTYFASGGHFWVATCVEENGEEVIMGMVGLEGKPDKAFELRRMSVRAEYRRHGVGKKLVTHLEQWARDQGLAKIWLSAAVVAAPAFKFYSSLGFTQTKVDTYPEYPLFTVAFFEKELI